MQTVVRDVELQPLMLRLPAKPKADRDPVQ